MDILLNKVEEDNLKLKQLLDKSSESGKIAYDIGKIAKEIKDKQSYKQFLNDKTVEPYKDFAEYCKLELNKTEDTIKKYIKIAESFQDESEVSEIMVTHLHELVRIKNDSIRKIALKVYKKHLKEYHFGRKAPRHTPFNKRTLKRIVNEIKNTEKLSEYSINEIINRVVYFNTTENSKKTKTDIVGGVLQSNKIDTKLFARIPIDEQGTVALFCVIFNQLCKVQFPFEINGRTEILTFSHIFIIRTQFPDAIICFEKITSRNFPIYPKLNVEFEFASSNYISHEHIYAKEKCDMIICWNNNIDRDNRKKFSKYQSDKIPPIFSISEFLETGEIKFS